VPTSIMMPGDSASEKIARTGTAIPAIPKGIKNNRFAAELILVSTPRLLMMPLMEPQAMVRITPHQMPDQPAAKSPTKPSLSGSKNAETSRPATESAAPVQNQPMLRTKTEPSYSRVRAFSSDSFIMAIAT